MVWVYQILIIHSLVDRQLRWFPLLPVVNRMLWRFICNFLLYITCLQFAGRRLYLGVELLGYMIILCLIYWGTARFFSIVAAPSYIPTGDVWEYQFFHISANTYFPFFYVIVILVGAKGSLSGFLLEGFVPQNSSNIFSGRKRVQAQSLP